MLLARFLRMGLLAYHPGRPNPTQSTSAWAVHGLSVTSRTSPPADTVAAHVQRMSMAAHADPAPTHGNNELGGSGAAWAAAVGEEDQGGGVVAVPARVVAALRATLPPGTATLQAAAGACATAVTAVDLRHLPPTAHLHTPAQLRGEARLRGLAAALAGPAWLAPRPHANAAVAAATGGGAALDEDGGVAAALRRAVAAYCSPTPGVWRAGVAAFQGLVPALEGIAGDQLAHEPQIGSWMPRESMRALLDALWVGWGLVGPEGGCFLRPSTLRSLLAAVAQWACTQPDGAGRSEGARASALLAALDARDAAAQRAALAAAATVMRVEEVEGDSLAAAPPAQDEAPHPHQPDVPPSQPLAATQLADGVVVPREGAAPPDYLSACGLTPALTHHLIVSCKLQDCQAHTSARTSAAAVTRMGWAVADLARVHGHSHPYTLVALALQARAMAAAAPLPAEDVAGAQASLSALNSQEADTQEGSGGGAAGSGAAPGATEQGGAETASGSADGSSSLVSMAIQAERTALRVLELCSLSAAAAAGAEASGRAVAESLLRGVAAAGAHAHAVLADLRGRQGRHEQAAAHWHACVEARWAARLSRRMRSLRDCLPAE